MSSKLGFKINAIVKKRSTRKLGMQYLVRWKGSPENVSWKTRQSLIRDIPQDGLQVI